MNLIWPAKSACLLAALGIRGMGYSGISDVVFLIRQFKLCKRHWGMWCRLWGSAIFLLVGYRRSKVPLSLINSYSTQSFQTLVIVLKAEIVPWSKRRTFWDIISETNLINGGWIGGAGRVKQERVFQAWLVPYGNRSLLLDDCIK